jgi:hypothetical protein
MISIRSLRALHASRWHEGKFSFGFVIGLDVELPRNPELASQPVAWHCVDKALTAPLFTQDTTSEGL